MPTNEALIRRLREEIERLRDDYASGLRIRKQLESTIHLQDEGAATSMTIIADKQARIEAALALHVEGQDPHGPPSGRCDECMKPWPCPTVNALKGEER